MFLERSLQIDGGMIQTCIALPRSMESAVSDYRLLTFEYVSSKLQYFPDTGKFYWLVNPAKNIKIGFEAGCVKACRIKGSGEPAKYRYIRLDGTEIPAAQLAWLLGTGEWARGKIYYLDKNPLNLSLSNLEISHFVEEKFDHRDPEQRSEYMRLHRKRHPLVRKDSDLRTRFGISLSEYGAMLVAQEGKCAICKKPETQTRKGVAKLMAVDHDHNTGKIRGLLCTACNQAIGKLNEDPELFASATAYLASHKERPN